MTNLVNYYEIQISSWKYRVNEDSHGKWVGFTFLPKTLLFFVVFCFILLKACGNPKLTQYKLLIRQAKIISFLNRLWSFIRLTRVIFLLGGFLLYALGAALAVRNGIKIDWSLYLLGQVVVTSIQLMAQYLNVYYDREVDNLSTANRTWFSGGSGILSNGIISPTSVLTAARNCGVFALFAGIFSSLHSIWMIPIILFSLFGSWFYSSPPLSLMSSGWGELSTSIIVTLLVPMAGYSIQGSFPKGEFWLMWFPLFLVHFAMLIAFEIPDQGVDQLVGKKTLTVRIGLKGAAYLSDALIGCAFLIVIILMSYSNYPGKWMLWVAPLAIFQLGLVHGIVLSPTRPRLFLLTTVALSIFVLMASLSLFGVIFVV